MKLVKLMRLYHNVLSSIYFVNQVVHRFEVRSTYHYSYILLHEIYNYLSFGFLLIDDGLSSPLSQ